MDLIGLDEKKKPFVRHFGKFGCISWNPLYIYINSKPQSEFWFISKFGFYKNQTSTGKLISQNLRQEGYLINPVGYRQ